MIYIIYNHICTETYYPVFGVSLFTSIEGRCQRLQSFICSYEEAVHREYPPRTWKWWWSLTYTGRCNWLPSCSVNNQQVLTLLVLCWCCRHCWYVVGVSKLLEWRWHVVLVGLVLLVCCCCEQFWGSNPIDVTSMYVSKTPGPEKQLPPDLTVSVDGYPWTKGQVASQNCWKNATASIW